MADRDPNPDLWMVKSGPRQPLKVAIYTKVSYQLFRYLAEHT